MHAGVRRFLAYSPRGPLGRRRPGIFRVRGGVAIDRGETKIKIEGEMIVAAMDRSVGTETRGDTIVGGSRGIVIENVCGADVIGGDMMIDDRPIREGCGPQLMIGTKG